MRSWWYLGLKFQEMFQRYSEDKKRGWLEEWKKSGKSIKAFSKDKPFSSHSLYGWHKKQSTPPGSGFVELSPLVDPGTMLRIIYPNGLRVEINQPISLDQIIQLVKC